MESMSKVSGAHSSFLKATRPAMQIVQSQSGEETEDGHTFDVGLQGVGLPRTHTVHVVANLDTFLFRAKDDDDRRGNDAMAR